MVTPLFRPWLSALPVVVAALLAPTQAAAQTPAPATESCVTCHQTMDGAVAAPTKTIGDDIHRSKGFGCTACHGGDPTSDDPMVAMDPAKGFKGSLKASAGVEACAKCHSDAAFMRRYAPTQRVDQHTEYVTSVHGQRLARGDTKVATCAACHTAHEIRAVKDAKSPVYPTNVAATCAKCHADKTHMAGYTRADGTPLPTTQHDDYRTSVHFEALAKKSDLSAPTCNDCHGNHGAAPPGAGSVTNVCGTCHTVFATKLQASPHAAVFEKGCMECHSNHAVQRPSDAMLGMSDGAICVTCHGGDTGAETATAMRTSIDGLKTAIDRTTGLLQRLHASGMEVGDHQLALREARSQLTLSRAEIHGLDRAAVEKITAQGLAITTKVEEAGADATAELRYRRRGLAASLVAILLTVVALVAKIRQMESRTPANGPDA